MAIGVICGVIGVLLIIFAAGTGDFYVMELHQKVPGNRDTKMACYSVIFLAVACICGYILNHVDFDEMYNIENIPVYFTKSIKREFNNNAFFKKQIYNALDEFYNGCWGNADIVRINDNDEAYDSGRGEIVGSYNTIRGSVYIITNGDRTATKIIFENEYLAVMTA